MLPIQTSATKENCIPFNRPDIFIKAFQVVAEPNKRLSSLAYIYEVLASVWVKIMGLVMDGSQ